MISSNDGIINANVSWLYSPIIQYSVLSGIINGNVIGLCEISSI